MFEILTLVQLKKLGSKYPVPVILVDWDGFYASLMQFLKACDENGTVGAPGALLGSTVWVGGQRLLKVWGLAHCPVCPPACLPACLHVASACPTCLLPCRASGPDCGAGQRGGAGCAAAGGRERVHAHVHALPTCLLACRAAGRACTRALAVGGT